MSEHTPWKIRTDLFGAAHVYDNTGQRLTNDRLTGQPDWMEIAHLIAAAPETADERDRLQKLCGELLKTAEQLLKVRSVRIMEEAAREYPHGKEDVADVLAGFDNIRAAIGKAKEQGL